MKLAASAFTALLTLATASVAQAQSSRCGPAPALQEPSEEARRVYEAAKEHGRQGRYEEALAAYQRAYDLSPSYIILFNIAKAAELTGDYARALGAYECHLAHGGPDIDPARHAEVEATLNMLKRKVGLLAVQIDEVGARISIDGVVVGTSPLPAPVAVNPGTRLVAVEGSKSETRGIEVNEGARLVTVFDWVPNDVAPPPKPTGFRFPSGLIGASWIATGLLGVGTIVTGSMAAVGARDIEDDVYLGPGTQPAPGSDLDEKIDRVNAFATATDVLLTAFLITGTAAVSFSIVNAVNKPDDASGDEPPAATRVEAFIGPTGARLCVRAF